MNVILKSFYAKKLLLFTFDGIIKRKKLDICSFSHFHSKKDLLVCRTFSRNCVLERQYMDLASIIKIFEEKVPAHLSEKWDNTGLLIEPSIKDSISTILFTNDLTEAVLEEALALKSDLIISYHPPIFAPIKSLRKSNWKERIVIKCLENSIAVYSPHTSCDAVSGGVNDWLISCFDTSACHPILPSYENSKYSHILEFSLPAGEDIHKLIESVSDSELYDISNNIDFLKYRVKVSQSSLNLLVLKLISVDVDASSITMTPLNPVPIPTCGMGRIGKLRNPLPLSEALKVVKNHLKLNSIRFSKSASHSLDSSISTVAVCAGSGSSVLKGVSADLYITGEMSHHDLLDANHRNVSVILCEHSNSERGYLKQLSESLSEKLSGVKLVISSSDKDPVTII